VETTVVTDAGLEAGMLKTFMDGDDEPPTEDEPEPEAPEIPEEPQPEEPPPEEAKPEAGDDEPEPGEEAPKEPETDEEPIEGLSDEQRERIQKRIDKAVGQKKAAEERAEAQDQRVTELEAKVEELTNAKPEETKAISEPHELMLVDTKQQIEDYDAYLAKGEAWLLANWDGYESVDDDTGEETVYTAAQMRTRWQEVRDQREKLIPQAHQALMQREADTAAAREVYPDLFVTTHNDYGIVQRALATVPELKRLPGYMTIIGDMLAGERARNANAKKPKAKKPAKAPPAPPKSSAAPTSAVKPSNRSGLKPGQLAAAGINPDEMTDDQAVALMDAVST